MQLKLDRIASNTGSLDTAESKTFALTFVDSAASFPFSTNVTLAVTAAEASNYEIGKNYDLTINPTTA